jgi:hypothetical protein
MQNPTLPSETPVASPGDTLKMAALPWDEAEAPASVLVPTPSYRVRDTLIPDTVSWDLSSHYLDGD